MSRCTGHCCERIFLRDGDGQPIDIAKLKATPRAFVDGEKVVDMLIDHPSGEPNVFTCRHFDRETRNCMIYETRPEVCRTYPNGRSCTFEGCTLENRGCKS